MGSCDGIDALIGNCVPCGYDNSNFGTTPEFNALAWTNGGAISNHRSLINWNLSEIPSTSIVQSAYLSLYYNPTSSNASGAHSSISGPNNAFLKRITSPWDENTVTWNTQPTTTTVNQAPLLVSTSSNQDYLNIDVTALMQDIISNPTTSYGMMLQLDVESYYRCLLFASSDNSNEALHPKLDICYSIPNAIMDISKSNFNVFPNPSNGSISIELNNNKNGSQFDIVDALGQTVFTEKIISINTSIKLNLAKGLYVGSLNNGSDKFVKKIVIM